MPAVQHILVPVDFSPTAARALRYGFHIAQAFSAKLTLVHVMGAADTAASIEAAEEKMTAMVPEAFDGRLTVRALALSSSIQDDLLARVEQYAPDLVVMGTRGLRPFRRFLLGSTTERLLRLMPVPLITVSNPDERGEPAEERAVNRILYPTDFSDSTELALPMALEFARRFGAELELVHVIDRLRYSVTTPYTPAELIEERDGMIRLADERLGNIAAQISGAISGIRVARTVLEGRPWEEILAHTARTSADLIVMGLHGMNFLERALLGATAEHVVRAAGVPVLGVPGTAAR